MWTKPTHATVYKYCLVLRSTLSTLKNSAPKLCSVARGPKTDCDITIYLYRSYYGLMKHSLTTWISQGSVMEFDGDWSRERPQVRIRQAVSQTCAPPRRRRRHFCHAAAADCQGSARRRRRPFCRTARRRGCTKQFNVAI